MLGTLLQVGAGASIGALQSALQHSTGEAGVSSPIYEAVHPEQLVPSPVNGHRPFVRYPGSLTTPPCSEGVQASYLGQWGDVVGAHSAECSKKHVAGIRLGDVVGTHLILHRHPVC